LTKPVIDSAAAEAANDSDIAISDEGSEISSSEDEEDFGVDHEQIISVRGVEPQFGHGHITRERVSTKGHIRPFEPMEEIVALHVPIERVGVVHGDGAINKWLLEREKYDTKYSAEMKKLVEIKSEDRKLAEAHGFLTRTLLNERPPLCALAGWYDQKLAREVGKSVDETSTKTSGAVALWMKLGTKVRYVPNFLGTATDFRRPTQNKPIPARSALSTPNHKKRRKRPRPLMPRRLDKTMPT
jgi:hypothetical protein